MPPAAWPLPNVWVGTSVENQRYADLRVPDLLDTPAAVRFLSVEPLLGPVDLEWRDLLWKIEKCPRCDGSMSIPVPGGGAACPDCLDDRSGQGNRTTRAIDWVIVGGESGPGARPMHPDWARSIRDQCAAAGVPFFFKQWGEWAPIDPEPPSGHGTIAVPGGEWRHRLGIPATGGEVAVVRVGKKAAGRELDGRTWEEYP